MPQFNKGKGADIPEDIKQEQVESEKLIEHPPNPVPEFTAEQHEARAPLIEKINLLIDEVQSLEQEIDTLSKSAPREQVDDIFDVMRKMSARVEALQMEGVGLRQALHDQQDIIAGLETALVPVKDEPCDG